MKQQHIESKSSAAYIKTNCTSEGDFGMISSNNLDNSDNLGAKGNGTFES